MFFTAISCSQSFLEQETGTRYCKLVSDHELKFTLKIAPHCLKPVVWRNIKNGLQLLICLLRIIFPVLLRYHRTTLLTLKRILRHNQHIWLHLTKQWKPSSSLRFRIISSDSAHQKSSSRDLGYQNYQSSSPRDDPSSPRSLVSRCTTP